jgi:hypothetical protein
MIRTSIKQIKIINLLYGYVLITLNKWLLCHAIYYKLMHYVFSKNQVIQGGLHKAKSHSIEK